MEEEKRSAEPDDVDDEGSVESQSFTDEDDWIMTRVSSEKDYPITSKVPASHDDERSTGDSGLAMIDDDLDDSRDSDCDWFSSIGAPISAVRSQTKLSPGRNSPAATRAPFVSSTPILKKKSAFSKCPFFGSSDASSLSSVFSEDQFLQSSGADASRDDGRFSLISSTSDCHSNRENGRQTRFCFVFVPRSHAMSIGPTLTGCAKLSALAHET